MTCIAVTGANGLLGQKVAERFSRIRKAAVCGCGLGDSSTCAGSLSSWEEVDVSSMESVLDWFSRVKPDVAVHAAAKTDVDACEESRLEAMAVNAEGTANVAMACAGAGARMVYVSTEYVFDGLAGPYGETDDPNPISIYAKSKYEGEMRAAAQIGNLVICRTTVLFGRNRGGALNFATWLLRELGAGRRVRIVDDQRGSPTLADNLAEMIAALALSDRRGVYNTAGADVLSRFEFATRIASAFDLDATLIEPVSTFSLCQKAPRPLSAGLRMDKFRANFPEVPVLGVDEALAVLRDQMDAAQDGRRGGGL